MKENFIKHQCDNYQLVEMLYKLLWKVQFHCYYMINKENDRYNGFENLILKK